MIETTTVRPTATAAADPATLVHTHGPTGIALAAGSIRELLPWLVQHGRT